MYLLDEMLLLLFEKIDLSKMTNFEIYQFFGRNFYLSIFDKKIFLAKLRSDGHRLYFGDDHV